MKNIGCLKAQITTRFTIKNFLRSMFAKTSSIKKLMLGTCVFSTILDEHGMKEKLHMSSL
jgi:hypothetical protein